MTNQNEYKALTIASSDSSGGAGIQADLKTFASVGVQGSSVITCITSQNTKEIKEIFEIPKPVIESQIDMIMQDIKPKVVKTGMLYSKETVEIVTKKLNEYGIQPVVDPVMSSTTGVKLSTKSFTQSLKNSLIPSALIVTPNLFEASEILRWKVRTLEDMINACIDLSYLGCKYVLLKGGHLEKEPIDVLYMGHGKFKKFPAIKINKSVHGTGCAYSALITSFLAMDFDIVKSVEMSKILITKAIEFSKKIGEGIDVVNPMSTLYNSAEKYYVIKDLKEMSRNLEKIPSTLIPEVGINIAYALPHATDPSDVCGIEGRIILVNDIPKKIGCIDFGASKHVAKIVLAAMHFNREIRCAMNIRYKEESITEFENLGFKVGSFDRKNEPENISTMEWGTKEVISKLGIIPDIIYDKGDIGKEPMIRILGKNPRDVINKLERFILISSRSIDKRSNHRK